MIQDMLIRHLVTLFLILLFSILLWNQKSPRDAEQRYFWLTVLSCLMLVLEDSLEIITSEDPSLRFWRTLMSVFGYTFRATAALGLLLVIVPRERRGFVLWIPSLATLLINSTAFFTDIAFGFDGDYMFYRGPLGFVSFAAPIIYLLQIIRITYRRFSESKGPQKYIIPGGALFCLAAAASDATHGGIRLDEAIMISSIFIYIIVRAHDNRRDPLTGLLNRQAFYDDSATYHAAITAVASMDMNGLKKMNDTLGHQAGDEALVRIAGCMNAYANRDTMVYRTGGDEFMILFFQKGEEEVARVTEQISENVRQTGCSISAGYAMRGAAGDLDGMIRESDSRMYEDKANYYRAKERDRRRGRDRAGSADSREPQAAVPGPDETSES